MGEESGRAGNDSSGGGGGGNGVTVMGSCHRGGRGQGWCRESVTRSRKTGSPPPPKHKRNGRV